MHGSSRCSAGTRYRPCQSCTPITNDDRSDERMKRGEWKRDSIFTLLSPPARASCLPEKGREEDCVPAPVIANEYERVRGRCHPQPFPVRLRELADERGPRSCSSLHRAVHGGGRFLIISSSCKPFSSFLLILIHCCAVINREEEAINAILPQHGISHCHKGGFRQISSPSCVTSHRSVLIACQSL